MRLASELLVVQHEYPSSLGATWRVDGPVLQSMSRKLQALRRSCVGSLEIQAAQLILRRFRRGEEQLMKGRAAWIVDVFLFFPAIDLEC